MGRVGEGKEGEQRLRLSPFPCRTIYDVRSSNVHTAMQRNVTATWNFVNKNTYFGIRHFIESPSLTSFNTGKGVPQLGEGGGRGYSTKFYVRRLRPEDQPLSLYIPFLTEKVPSFRPYTNLAHGKVGFQIWEIIISPAIIQVFLYNIEQCVQLTICYYTGDRED